MALYVLRLKGKNPYENLALEEYILTQLPKKAEDIYLVFYENSECIILGKNLVKEKEVYTHKHIPRIIRRNSGGGSVVHFKGNLNYGIILNTEAYPDFQSIPKSYDILMGTLASSLSSKLTYTHAGISDICVVTPRGNRKVSGNAQIRKKKWLLHHGTLLYNLQNLNHIPYFLKHPPKEPKYRSGKTHRDFMIHYLPNSSATTIMRKITKGFAKHFQQPVQFMHSVRILRQNSREFINATLRDKIVK